jgi:general secretion pathway protein F
MPVFRYKAVNPTGDVATGELEAANEGEIVDRLRDQGMLPMQVARTTGEAPAPVGGTRGPRAARRKWFASKSVTRDQLLTITSELATLLNAGLPLDRALETLIGLADATPAAALLQQIRDDVRGGKSLSQALDTRRDVFSRFYVNIVRAGEAGGALGVVLTRLAETMERNKDLRESVKSALIYPSILIGVAVLSVMVLLVWVVPQFEQTFAQAGKALPLPTLVVIVLGTGLRQWWWAIAGLVVATVWWIRRRLAQPAIRLRWDGRVLRMPLVGDLVTKVEVARFARTLATLLGNGVTLLSGLAILKDTLGNTVLAASLDGVIARLREGKGFGRPLAETGLYPKLAVQMVLVGEESGRLEEMLGRVADVYDREVQMAVKRFLAVLEPALILSLAVLIGGIVFSILLGVMGMSELVQ